MKGSPALRILLAALLGVFWTQGYSAEEPDRPGSSEADGEQTAPPTQDEPAQAAHFVTTAPTLKLLNHHPLLEDFLHDTLLKKDYLQQIPFALPDASTNNMADQDSHLALSDIAAVPTAAPSVLSPTALMGKKAEDRDAKRTPEMAKPAAFNTEQLTTAMGHLEPWAESGQAAPSISPLFKHVQASVTPRQDLTRTSLSNSNSATSTVWPEVIMPNMVSEPCNWNLTGLEGSLASPLPSSVPYKGGMLECTYTISVYPGYGVEIQVQNISLSEGELITVEMLGGLEPVTLANESFLMRGQVIRGPTNQVVVQFRSPVPANPGTFHFRFQAYLLSCAFPTRPAYGDVSVTSLHAGGIAYFSCAMGYQLMGQQHLTCLNATYPFWSSQEPTCVAACGGVIRNASIGSIVSPGFPHNYSNNLTCHWLVEAPAGQRLHLHFEKVSLAEDDDRLIIRNGDNIEAPPVYDSYEVEYLPIEGLISTSRSFFIELTTDSGGVAAGIALRYEAFEPGHCYEPFVRYGNFTTTDATYAVGTTVEFTCEAGYTLEQGSVIIECIDPSNPQWNETEPACRAVCSGEITDAAGVVLSPNWPEPYGKGQDCIWGLHVEEDKRILLDVQALTLGKGDVLTFYDGDDLTARILGQYSSQHRRFKLCTSMADVTVQFQSDPGNDVLGYQRGFVIHFSEVPRNDTCPELPEVPNGWKTASHPELIHGTVVTYHCYPGYELVGTELLMCHWDLTWSGDLPSCQRVTTCRDPGDVDHSRRVVSSNTFPVGSTVQFICDKGYALAGSGVITCQDRQHGGPKWSDRLPKCTPEAYDPCHNPGIPEHGTQNPERRTYPAGATLHFACTAGFLLLGSATLRCMPGHPSHWNGSPPLCKAASYDEFYTNHNLDAKAKVVPARDPLQGSNVAFAVFLPVAAVGLLLSSAYLYITRNREKPPLQLLLSNSHPYDHITVDSAFTNSSYETRETQKYEVSI